MKEGAFWMRKAKDLGTNLLNTNELIGHMLMVSRVMSDFAVNSV